jgi:hypothetical protein
MRVSLDAIRRYGLAASLSAKTAEGEGCWLWTGTTTRDGYAIIGRRVGLFRASRVAWTIHNRRDLADGELICHSCDNPRCVRPDHLFAGSHADNMADMARKGRTKRTHCKRGHEFTPDNTTMASGRRTCRQCVNDRLKSPSRLAYARRWQAEKRGGSVAP